MMRSHRLDAWMWGEACQLLEQAERLRQQFFRLADPGRAEVAWEPPVDIIEDENEILIAVALPGVAEADVDVSIEDGTLIVRARREFTLAGGRCEVHRLEIPHGRFERRIRLPEVPLRLHARKLTDGCLVLRLSRAQ